MSSKRNKKDLDEELSSSEEEVDVKKNVKKAQNAPAKKAVKKDESIESSDEDVNMLKGKSNRKLPQKKKVPPKKEESDDDDDDSEEDVKPKKANVTAGKKIQPKKEESSDDDDSEEEDKPKKGVTTKKAPAKKESSSEDDDSDEDDKPKKAAPAKKAPVKKEESSDDDDDESEEPPKKAAPAKKAPVKKEESSDDDDDDSEDDLPKKPVKKTPAKKEESSDDDDDDSEEEPPKKAAPAKKTQAKKEESSDEDDDDDEDDEPKKPAPAAKKAPAKKEESSDDDDEDDDEEDKKPKKEDEDAEDEVPPEAFEELFVRNLSFKTTEESLANFFMKFGDVEVARILTDKSTGKSRGIAFVKFYEKKAAYEAMKSKDDLNLDSRQLQIRYSNDKSYQSGQASAGDKKPSYQGDRHSIFVGNLSFKCNENSIRKHFSSCGNVVDIRLAKRDDGKLKGFAHVDFDSEEGVQKALELNGKELDGRPLKIDVSTPKQGGGNRGGNRGGRGGRGGNRGGNVDPLAKAKKSGAIIAPSESKVKTFDDSDDE